MKSLTVSSAPRIGLSSKRFSAWLDQENERSRLTREALLDVDAGQVIDHQTVED